MLAEYHLPLPPRTLDDADPETRALLLLHTPLDEVFAARARKN